MKTGWIGRGDVASGEEEQYLAPALEGRFLRRARHLTLEGAARKLGAARPRVRDDDGCYWPQTGLPAAYVGGTPIGVAFSNDLGSFTSEPAPNLIVNVLSRRIEHYPVGSPVQLSQALVRFHSPYIPQDKQHDEEWCLLLPSAFDVSKADYWFYSGLRPDGCAAGILPISMEIHIRDHLDKENILAHVHVGDGATIQGPGYYEYALSVEANDPKTGRSSLFVFSGDVLVGCTADTEPL